MGRQERIELIKRIEEIRGSRVVSYLTAIRPNVIGQIAEDAVRIMFDHLLLLPSRPVEKLDLFLCSNGGATQVPWRLVSLFREFAKSFSVLIPYRAYSAATLLALGADEIVMHPFAELGPIDPTVTNAFNPIDDDTRQRLGISVEDVKAYVSFIKTTVGITHEDELVKAIEILANKVHPLALGNVERFISQSRMIAAKVLRTHMSDVSDHVINEIVENMASKLYFHGHPINRREARKDLNLKINDDLPPELETSMWDLYKTYEEEFDSQTTFAPIHEIASRFPEVTAQQIPTQPFVTGTKEFDLLHAMVESAKLTSRYTSKRRYTVVRFVHNGQQVNFEDILNQGWSQEQV
jgi:hypothetical protein